MPTVLARLVSSSDTYRRLFGIPREIARQADQAQLYFAGSWPIRLLVLMLVIAAVWFGALYLLDGKRPSLFVKVPLLALRMLALGAIALILLQPMLRVQHRDRIKPAVVIMVDTSQSMGARDPRLPAARAEAEERGSGVSPAAASRDEIAARILNHRDARLFATLSKRYALKLYTFHGDAHAVQLPAEPAKLARFQWNLQTDTKHGASTQMGTSLRRVLDDVTGQPTAGVLLVSDGGNNLGDDPASLAERARMQGARLSTMGIGDPTPTKDLAVTEVLADQVVRAENTVQVFAGVSHRGYAGRAITVNLTRNGAPFQSKTLVLGPESRKQTVAFTYVPKQAGAFNYVVSTAVLDGEITGENNRRAFGQKVVTKKLRILYVEGEPRWEYRYLKNAVLRDTQILFSCLLTAPDAPVGGEGNVPITKFPADEKQLFAYDILILGDVPRAFFSDLQLRNIRRFVEDKGGSLMVVSGEKHMPAEYRDTVLEGILPVVLPSAPEQVVTDEPWQWELTPEGRQDPLLRLSDDPTENAQIWANLPGMFWNAGALRAKPGATVLAVNPARRNAYGKRIVLAVQPFGSGRCLISMTDSTWRWRWKVGDKYFYRYWGQAIRSMTPKEMPGGNRFAQVNTDRNDYMLGERVSVHARLLDDFYRPVKSSQAKGVIHSDTWGDTPLVLNALPGSPGLYSAEVLADRLGRFQLSVASPANPGAKAVTTYMVQTVALEKQQPEMNEALLKRVAASGGGGYYPPDELKAWMGSLKADAPEIRTETEVELWDAPLLLALFVVPLLLEWLGRKRSGMM